MISGYNIRRSLLPCVDAMEALDNVTLPDGTELPGSPENRTKARKLWEDDNKIETIDTELTAEQARVKALEEMLREQRIEFEQDREREQRDKALEQQEREREREYWRNREQEREHEIQEERDRRIQAEHEAEKAEMAAGYERQLREVEKKMTETALHDRAGTDDQRNRSALREQELHRMTQESLLEFSLPVNHSSTDVIVDLANCFALMRETRSDGTAVSDATATTIAGLFDKVNEKSPELRLIFENRIQNSSLASTVNQYRREYLSKRTMNRETLMVSMILALTRFYSDKAHRVKAAVIKAGSILHEDRVQLIEKVKRDGTFEAPNCQTMNQKLIEMTGMKQLIMRQEGDREMIASFENLVVQYVCFEPDQHKKLKSATVDWLSLDGKQYTDCEKLINDDARLFGNCTSYFDGKEIRNDLQHFENLMSISPDRVRIAYADYVSSPQSTETERTMMLKSWTEFLDVLRLVWTAADSKQSLYAEVTGGNCRIDETNDSDEK